MNLNEYFEKHKQFVKMGDHSYRSATPRIHCADGFNVSAQVRNSAYCTPRGNHGPYTHCELGFPSAILPDSFLSYCEDPDHPLDTVYAYVPVELVEELIEQHGGIVDDKHTPEN